MVAMEVETQGQGPPSKVDPTLVERAVTALLKHHEKANESSNDTALLGDDIPVHVQFTLSRVPTVQNVTQRPIRIDIPHSLHKVNPKEDNDEEEGMDEVEVCIIVKDESKEHVKELIAQFPSQMSYVKKVLTLTSLRNKYKQYQHKRELLSQYGLFMADERILPMLGSLLGKTFFKHKKQPIPIKVSRSQALPYTIQKSLKSTFFTVGAGTCISVKAGNTAMPTKNIHENMLAVIQNVANKIPRKWGNIKAINIKTARSVSLPVYNKTPEELEEIVRLSKEGRDGKEDQVSIDTMKEKKRSRDEEEEKDNKLVEEEEVSKSKSPLLQALKKQKKAKKAKTTKSTPSTPSIEPEPTSNESKTPSKTKKVKGSIMEEDTTPEEKATSDETTKETKSKKKRKKDSKKETTTTDETHTTNETSTTTPKRKKKEKTTSDSKTDQESTTSSTPKSAKKKDVSAAAANEKAEKKTFVTSKKFKGAKKGYVFKKGSKGTGYYVDVKPVPDTAALAALARSAKQGKAGGGGGKRRKSRGRR